MKIKRCPVKSIDSIYRMRYDYDELTRYRTPQECETMTTVRKETLEYISKIQDAALEALLPILKLLSYDEPLIIETDLTEEEKAIIAEGMA